MQRLQEPELYDDEEQEEAYRPDGNEKVLQPVPQAHRAPRSEVREQKQASEEGVETDVI
jgi:hypothetical protein